MNDRTKTTNLVLLIVVGMIAAIVLVRIADARRPPVDVAVNDESLYLNAKTARRISLGFNGLAADWYWMRSLQYVGKKILNAGHEVALDNLSQLNLALLGSLLENATTLDPQFLEPYEYAAVVLPAIDVQEAIRITRNGIEANPNAWRLYQHLGYIYWQQHDYATAAEVYGRGAEVPGAPVWMRAMSARMAAEGGSRETAREIYTSILKESADKQVQEMAGKRLLQLDSLVQRDGLRKMLLAYQKRTGRCPATWREIFPAAPQDPSGAPYVLQPGKCKVELAEESGILR